MSHCDYLKEFQCRSRVEFCVLDKFLTTGSSGVVNALAEENILDLAKAEKVPPQAITAMILDRPRHADLIAAVRKAGAAVSLITDGDVAGVIHTAEPEKTGIDICLGITRSVFSCNFFGSEVRSTKRKSSRAFRGLSVICPAT